MTFDQELGPRIAVLPVCEKEKLHISGWQLTKALESGAWRGCEGTMAQVEVYAWAAEIELQINGKHAARKKCDPAPAGKCSEFLMKTAY